MNSPEPVEELQSPTAPEHPAGSAVVADLPQVCPPAPGPRPAVLAAVAAGGGLCFLALTVWVERHAGLPTIDRSIHSWVLEHRTGSTVTFARAVTWGGVTTVVLPALIVVGAVARRGGSDLRRRLGSGMLLAGVASVGVYLGLRVNAWAGRARPSVADWAGSAGGPSFPSGHTTAATLFAASCAWAIGARLAAGWPRHSVWIGAAVYAGLVGWSRVWLGVHWPTDVIGGWLYGVTWFTAASAVIRVARSRANRRRQSR